MRSSNQRLLSLSICVALILAASELGAAQIFRRGGGQPAKGMVNLPYRPQQTDAFGNQWYIYQGGWIRQIGNMPVYSEGGMLMIDGNQPNMNSNQARLEDNGELIFENMQANNCTITRRMLINKEEGYIRIIDIFKNTQAQASSINVSYRSSLNYGLQGSQTVADPKKKDQALGIIAQDGQGRNVVEVYAGRGSKTVPQVSAQPNNNQIQASLTIAVPAGKEVAVMHLHAITASNDAGIKLVAGLKESQLLKDVPKPIRKMICNFTAGTAFIGDDVEILRGESFDVVELRSGDSFKGTLREPAWKLNTFYGPVELSPEKVIAMVNVGESRPRQLLVTMDGEIYGGRLTSQTVALELSSGQVTQIPLSQITRIGYRKRPGEPEEWNFEKPMVLLRSGERIGIEMPTAPVNVATRYGPLKLSPGTIGSVAFQSEEHGVHEVFLTDGSRFAGLVTEESFEMKLSNTAGNPVVRFPASTIARLQLTIKVDDPDESTPALKLANEDMMVGTLTGNYKLDMAFDTLSINGDQIKRIVHNKSSPLDCQITLWDDTTVSGQLQEPELQCQLNSGVAMKVPVALLSEYQQPAPTPSDSMAKQVAAVVKKLNAEDWKERDNAEKQLRGMGVAIAGILKSLRNGQPPEAQQRIDAVLSDFKSSGAPTGAAPGTDAPVLLDR